MADYFSYVDHYPEAILNTMEPAIRSTLVPSPENDPLYPDKNEIDEESDDAESSGTVRRPKITKKNSQDSAIATYE